MVVVELVELAIAQLMVLEEVAVHQDQVEAMEMEELEDQDHQEEALQVIHQAVVEVVALVTMEGIAVSRLVG